MEKCYFHKDYHPNCSGKDTPFWCKTLNSFLCYWHMRRFGCECSNPGWPKREGWVDV